MVNTIQRSKASHHGKISGSGAPRDRTGGNYDLIFGHVNAGFSVSPFSCTLHDTMSITGTRRFVRFVRKMVGENCKWLQAVLACLFWSNVRHRIVLEHTPNLNTPCPRTYSYSMRKPYA
ncbi:MAG: hypothetical protein ABF628_09120 [Acetobacter orientalis]|uniref:hypothetical protein n=1 Tax=Acetobacter orientalis TaxID=146474 RepID=UPI0039EA8555